MAKTRKKAAEGGTTSMAHRLVAAWTGESMEMAPIVLDEIMRRKNASDIIDKAIALSEGDTDFAKFLFALSGTVFALLRSETGETLRGRANLFTVVVNGPDEDIDDLKEPALFNAVLRQVRACGYVHPKSQVMACTVLLDGPSAANANPADIRHLCRTLVSSMSTASAQDDTPTGAVAKLRLNPNEDEEPLTGKTVTRMFVGVRLVMDEQNEMQGDLFDPPGYTQGRLDDTTAQHHAVAVLKASRRFMDSCTDLAQSRGLEVTVNGPYNWTGGLSAMAMVQMQSDLKSLGFDTGIEGEKEAYISSDADNLHIAAKTGQTFVGPVGVPLSLAVYSGQYLQDWLDRNFKRVIRYDDVETLLTKSASTHH